MTAFVSSTWTLGALVFIATWSGGFEDPVPLSIDHSLHAGLQMAALERLDFGTDLVFTYGPLGFLKSYLVFEAGPARLAAVYGALLQLALCLSLVWAFRRSFHPLLAVGLAFVIAALCRGDLGAEAVRDDAAVVVLALIWCVAALLPGAPEWARRIVIYGGGPYAAIEVLAKLNTGLVVIALVGLALVVMDGDRRFNLALPTALFAATFAALWAATSQGIGNLDDFITGSLEIIRGYSAGARLDFGWEDRSLDYVFGPMLIVIVGALCWVSTSGVATLRRGAIFAMFAVVAFTATKGGFVSHEIFHMATFYGTMAGACAAFPVPPRQGMRIAALAGTGAAAAAGFSAAFWGEYPRLNPVDNVRNAIETTVDLVDSQRLRTEIEADRSRLVADYDLDRRSLDLLAGHTVHVDPSEAAAAWAYELDWHPLPIFQPYAAWTEELDQQNADALASPDGPERVLRLNLNPLGRYPGYESPAAMLALLCNFEAIHTTHKWQVLSRVPDRCGEPHRIGSSESTFGSPLVVPKAPRGQIAFARVEGVQVSGLESVRNALLRARGRQVRFAGDDHLYTFIAATAANGLIMRAPKSIDFPKPFALAPNGDEVTFFYEGGAADKPITAEFFAMPVRPAGE